MNNQKQKLWILSEVFYPDQTTTAYILTEIARFMTQYYDVSVIAGPVGYDKVNVADSGCKINEEVSIIRSGCFIKNKNNLFFRLLRQLIITFQLVWNCFRYVSKGDKVIIVTNPAPLLLLMSFIKRLKRIELNILVHDVFPENTIPAGLFKSSRNPFYKILKACFSWAYAQADGLIVLGRDMQEIMKQKIEFHTRQPKINIVENWAETESVYPILRSVGIDERFSSKIVIGYAGNYGRVQGLMNLLAIAGKIDNNRIFFRFWGSGAMEDGMKEFVRKHSLTNVEINGAYIRTEQLHILNSCDIALVSLEPGMKGLGVPSKTYNILAAGKPVIFIGDSDSEIGQLVTANKIGWVFENIEDGRLLRFLNEMGGEEMEKLEQLKLKSRQLAERKYSKEIILEKFYQVIK